MSGNHREILCNTFCLILQHLIKQTIMMFDNDKFKPTDILALLRQPLSSSEDVEMPSIRSDYSQHMTMSFSEPFVDPDMEPLPIGPPQSSRRTDHQPQSKSVNVMETPRPLLQKQFVLFSSPSNVNKNADSRARRRGNKRTFDDVFSSDSITLHPKRQAISPHATSDQTVARFRP